MYVDMGWNLDGPYLKVKASGKEWEAPQWVAGGVVVALLILVLTIVMTGLAYWFNYFLG